MNVEEMGLARVCLCAVGPQEVRSDEQGETLQGTGGSAASSCTWSSHHGGEQSHFTLAVGAMSLFAGQKGKQFNTI